MEVSEAVELMQRRAQEIANARQEAEWLEKRCDACGSKLGFDDRAEVVDYRDAGRPYARHLIVHAEPCFNRSKYVLA